MYVMWYIFNVLINSIHLQKRSYDNLVNIQCNYLNYHGVQLYI